MRWLDRLLVLGAAVAVIANLLPLGARLWWTLELTTHFRVQYLAATAALLVLSRCGAGGALRRARGRRRRERSARPAVSAVRTA